MMLPLSSGADMIMAPATDADIGDVVALVNSAYRGVGAGWTNEVGLLAGPSRPLQPI
jgi:hypothetical protein